MIPRQPRRSKSAPKSQTANKPTHAWGEKRKALKNGSTERPFDDSLFKVSADNIFDEDSKPTRKRIIKKLSFRKKLSFSSKKESKSTSDLLIVDKKKSCQPLSLLLNPPDLVEDWYNVNDSPILAGKRTLSLEQRSSVSKSELSASSPNLRLVKAVELDAVELDTVELDAVELYPVEFELDTVELDTVKSDTVESDTVEFNPVEFNPVELDTVKSNPVRSDPIQMVVVPSNVALAAYPPSPYEFSCSPKSFASYLEEPKSPQFIGHSPSFPSHTLPLSPLTLKPGTKHTQCDASETSEVSGDSVRRQLSFGRTFFHQIKTTSFPGPDSKHTTVLNTSQSNFSFGRTRQVSIGDKGEQRDYKLTQYPGHNKVLMARVPVKGSPQASPTSHYHQGLRKIRNSHSFTAQTSYSADGLDSIDGNRRPKSSSMVCGYVPCIPRHAPSGSGHTPSASGHTPSASGHAPSMFRWPAPTQESPSCYRRHRTSYLNAVVTDPLRGPSHFSSTPMRTLNPSPPSPSFSCIGLGHSPVASSPHDHTGRLGHSPVTSSPHDYTGRLGHSLITSSPHDHTGSDIGSLVSLSAPSDASESFFSLFDTQSEIGFGSRVRGYGNNGRAYQSCRGQRVYRSMLLAKRHVLLSMFYCIVTVVNV